MVTSTSSSTSATSSLISALGGGSGIDMAALAANLATAQFAARTDRLTSKSDSLNAKISAASNIKSMLLSLDTSLGTLVRTGDLASKPTVANASVATATSTGAVGKGTYSLEVSKLAKGQQFASAPFAASTSTVGSGTLTLRFGTTTSTSFTEDTSHAAVDVTIPAGATLADVASAINAKDAGVTAYVANTVDGAQLVLKGAEGASDGFVLEATEDPADPGLSALAWSPGASTGTLLSASRDAEFKIDGLSMTSSSNTVASAIPGASLKLTGENPGAATSISFTDTTSSISSSMQDLTDALNEVMKELNTATGLGADLANDSGARALKRSLSQLAGTQIMPGATGNARTLADLGLKTERDGTFSLDTTRLNATIAVDPQGVAAMFTNGIYGVFATIDGIYRAASSATDPGSLGGSISRYTKQLQQVTSDQSDLVTKQEALRQQLVSRFAVSENNITASKSTLTFLQNQIQIWNNQKN